MIQSMNTGHDGSLSTGHANSPQDMLSRLETMALFASDIPIQAIRKQIASSIDIIVQLERLRDSSRRVTAIAEVLDCTEDTYILNPIFEFHEQDNLVMESSSYGGLWKALPAMGREKRCSRPEKLPWKTRSKPWREPLLC